MYRRKFIGSAIALTAIPALGMNTSSSKRLSSFPKTADLQMTDKVKLALLTIQRASWEHGVALQAFMECRDEDITLMMAQEAVLRQTDEGQLSVVYNDNGVTDAAASGEAVIYVWRKTGDEKFKRAYEKMLDYLLNKAPKTDGILHHVKNAPEIWIDAMYMAPPFLAAAGEYEEALKQIRGFKQCLWDPENQLFSHIYDINTKTFKRKDFWGVGNGWTAAGLARVIDTLPGSMQDEKSELTELVDQLLEGCLQYLRRDGLFHDVVNDPSTFIETNLSQMLAYTIYRGIASGWMDMKWESYADSMRDAALKKVDKYGFVQGVCGSPRFNSAGTAAEGQAFHILMEAAYKKYSDKLA